MISFPIGAWRRPVRHVVLFTAAALVASPGPADPPDREAASVFELSIEELMELPVTTRHKVEEASFTTPAAVYVITRRDIELSGAESIPDLLHRIPGVNAFQARRHSFAVAIRNDTQALLSTALVLVDGVPFYLPFTGSAAWELLPVSLAEIDRVEVIRGSGGSSWGANSSSGVINIITRRAGSAPVTSIAVGAGSQSRLEGTAEHTFTAAAHSLRLAASAESDDGFDAADRFRALQLVGRWDAQLGRWAASASLGGRGVRRDSEELLSGSKREIDLEAGFLWFTTHREVAGRDQLSLELAATRHDDESGEFAIDTRVDMVDLEGRYRIQWSAGTATQLQVDVRRYDLETAAFGPLVRFDPARTSLDLVALAVHHRQPLAGERLVAEVGARAEDYSGLPEGWLLAPAVRVSWRPAERTFLWAAATRNHQLPTFLQTNARGTYGIDPGSGNALMQWGNPDLEAEVVDDVQIGLRQAFGRHLVDVTAFHTEVDGQVNADPGSVMSVPGAEVISYANLIDATMKGVELSWRYRPLDRLRTELNLTYFSKDSVVKGDTSAYPGLAPAYAPEYSVSWVGSTTLPWGTEVGWTLTWVDDYVSESISGLFSAPFWIEDHWRLDLAVRQPLGRRFELGLAARNLLEEDLEWRYRGVAPSPTKVEPSMVLSLRYRLP